MAKERKFITVIAYPNFSKKYGNCICAAGFREDGSWIRIFPLPYRLLESDPPLKKNQWISLEIKKRSSDPRLESFEPRNLDDIDYQENIIRWPNEFRSRRELELLNKNEVSGSLEGVIRNAKENRTSLAIFRPARILGVKYKRAKLWSPEELSKAKAKLSQGSLLPINARSSLTPVRPLPFKFSYKFRDRDGRQSELMIEDWELWQYYWQCHEKTTELGAARQVTWRYKALINTKRLHFFIGTTHRHHDIAPNPYVIIGVFNLPVTLST